MDLKFILLTSLIILLNFNLVTFQLLNKPSSNDKKYDYNQEYSSNLRKIFEEYLSSTINDRESQCSKRNGISSDLNEDDFENAFQSAYKQISDYVANDKKYLDIDPRGLNFSSFLYQASLNAKFNEYATKNIVQGKCLSKYETEITLSSVETQENYWSRSQFCDLDSDVSPHIICDPKYKYRREDGKCNNLVRTNWGSSFHSGRRLLPPDYADGISLPRIASDGSPLPNSRLITLTLMPDIKELDPLRSSMHPIWGQFLAHDVLKTLQYWGFALNCCDPNITTSHEECLPVKDIPRDTYSQAYKNQSCLNVVRSIASNTCGLGPREQLNAATPLLDLSHIYGGNMNNTVSLRLFRQGLLRSGKSLTGNDYLPPKLSLPYDQDTLDANTCNPPADRPGMTCFLNGDGIRGNQQPMVMSLHSIFLMRHNQHAIQLNKVNPHWNDEMLYQEAKRILIAEYNKINFCEYFPKILNRDVMEYYGLYSKSDGFTQYDPNVDPRVVQSVGVATLRFGHSQVNSRYQVIKKPKYDSYGFQLRYKYGEMSDLWDGNANGVIGGLMGVPARAVDPFIVQDLHDFLFLQTKNPMINDLPALTINRGRDHGVPAYIYYVQYCTGFQVRSWTDLIKFIPEDYVKQLATIYKNVKDIDLFVGGIAERHLNDSILGPTFNCLLAIQVYHWKYGDRFHFEHSGQIGSFTLEQLNSIRKTSSVANLLCKTTDFDSIQSDPMFMPSKTNEKISCKQFPEIDYKLWREESPCSHYCEALRASKQNIKEQDKLLF